MSTYKGQLKFTVHGKQRKAGVTIFTIERDASAGGGWECMCIVRYRGKKYTGSTFAQGKMVGGKPKVLTDLQIIEALQTFLQTLRAPFKDIDVRQAKFEPKLTR